MERIWMLGAILALAVGNHAFASHYEHCGLRVQVLQLLEIHESAAPQSEITRELHIRIVDSHWRTASEITCAFMVEQTRTIQLKVGSLERAAAISLRAHLYIDYTLSASGKAVWKVEPNRRHFVQKVANISKTNISRLDGKDLDGTGSIHIFGIKGEIRLRLNLEGDSGFHEVILPLHGNPEAGTCNVPLYAFRTDQRLFGGRLETLTIADFSKNTCNIDAEAMTVVQYLRNELKAAQAGPKVEGKILAGSLIEVK